MYTVATHLVEEASGLKFPDFLDKHFFKPLAMESTNLQPARARARGLGDRIATGYKWNKESETYRAIPAPNCVEGQGAGSIITSANDYIKYVRAMMDHEGPFTEAVYKGVTRARTLCDPDYTDLLPHESPQLYAAGWHTCHYRGYMLIYHDGGISGFNSTHFFLPELKFGGVILANAGSNIDCILMHSLIDDALKLPVDQQTDWAKTYAEIVEKYQEEGVETLREQLRPGIKDPEPLKMPLSSYTGRYWNPGYHWMEVEVKDGQLFINASDRSGGFSLTFEHVCDQSSFIAHLIDDEDGDHEMFKAKFEVDGEKVSKMGLHIDVGLGYIWFDKMS